MDEGSSAKQIKKAIEHVYKPAYELKFFKNGAFKESSECTKMFHFSTLIH